MPGFQVSSSGGGGGVSDHGDLTGLADDDHTQYATNTELTAHLDDTSDAHDASAISIADAGNDFTATTVEGALDELQADNEAHVAAADPHTGYVKESDASWVDLTDSGETTLHTHPGGAGGAPTDADYLVGTANGSLSNEIVVGTSPNGELGGTWGAITVDATHSGSAHTDFIAKSFLDAKGDLITASADNTPAKLTVGSNDTILMADSGQSGGLKWVAAATPSTVGTSNSEGTADTFTRGDHVHAHEAAHVAHDTIFDAAGDLIVGSGADTSARLAKGNDGEVLSMVSGSVAWAAAAGGNDPRILVDSLTSGQQFTCTTNSETMTNVANLDVTLAAGNYYFQYNVIWRTNDATNGIKLNVNYTGTSGAFVFWWRWVDTSATASTAAADQDAIGSAGQVMGAHARRAKATTGTPGETISADTAGADMMIIVEGIFVATGSGDLELWAGNDAAGSGDTCTIEVGSSVIIYKTG